MTHFVAYLESTSALEIDYGPRDDEKGVIGAFKNVSERILERQMENGDDVENELERLANIRDEKLADQIPKELFPEN